MGRDRWWTYIFIQLSKPIECSTLRVNPDLNCGLWVIMVCQYRFMDFDRYTIVVCDVNRGWFVYVGAGDINKVVLPTVFP